MIKIIITIKRKSDCALKKVIKVAIYIAHLIFDSAKKCFLTLCL